jgi:hypothetical protein
MTNEQVRDISWLQAFGAVFGIIVLTPIIGGIVMCLWLSISAPGLFEVPHYEPADVQAICKQFDIASTDDLCAHTSEQTTVSLQRALVRKFPPGEASYDDFMYYAADLSARTYFCDPEPTYTPDPFSIGGCPEPDNICSGCWINLPFQGVRNILLIKFDSATGIIVEIEVPELD